MCFFYKLAFLYDFNIFCHEGLSESDIKGTETVTEPITVFFISRKEIFFYSRSNFILYMTVFFCSVCFILFTIVQ